MADLCDANLAESVEHNPDFLHLGKEDDFADIESSEEESDGEGSDKSLVRRQQEARNVYHGPMDVFDMTQLAWECKLQRFAGKCLEFILSHHHKVEPSLILLLIMTATDLSLVTLGGIPSAIFQSLAI